MKSNGVAWALVPVDDERLAAECLRLGALLPGERFRDHGLKLPARIRPSRPESPAVRLVRRVRQGAAPEVG